MELQAALTTGPARAYIARVLRDDLPLVLHFSRAAVFLPGPTGRPRLLASTGDEPTDPLLPGPSRLRTALVAAATDPLPRVVAFSADGHEPAGEALVVPLGPPLLGALVVYRAGGRFAGPEAKHVVAAARFVGRALAWSAAFA